MPITSNIKGVDSLKNIQHMNKTAIPKKVKSDFLELYMLEKEKKRLIVEKEKLMNRLEYINGRMTYIDSVYGRSAESIKRERYYDDVSGDDELCDIKTITLDY